MELKKDRALSLSLDNNLLTEVSGMDYSIGLGYRIKDLRIGRREQRVFKRGFKYESRFKHAR